MIRFINLEEVTKILNLEKENKVRNMIESNIDVEVRTPLIVAIRNQQINSRRDHFIRLRKV